MKPTFLQFGKKRILLEFVQYPADILNVMLFPIFVIDQDVIQIYDHEDIKLFCYDLIDIPLKRGWGIK